MSPGDVVIVRKDTETLTKGDLYQVVSTRRSSGSCPMVCIFKDGENCNYFSEKFSTLRLYDESG